MKPPSGEGVGPLPSTSICSLIGVSRVGRENKLQQEISDSLTNQWWSLHTVYIFYFFFNQVTKVGRKDFKLVRCSQSSTIQSIKIICMRAGLGRRDILKDRILQWKKRKISALKPFLWLCSWQVTNRRGGLLKRRVQESSKYKACGHPVLDAFSNRISGNLLTIDPSVQSSASSNLGWEALLIPLATPSQHCTVFQIPVFQIRALRLPPVVAILTWTSRSFFSDRFLGGRINRSEDKDGREPGLRRSCTTYIYAKQVDWEVQNLINSLQGKRKKMRQMSQEDIIQ